MWGVVSGVIRANANLKYLELAYWQTMAVGPTGILNVGAFKVSRILFFIIKLFQLNWLATETL